MLQPVGQKTEETLKDDVLVSEQPNRCIFQSTADIFCKYVAFVFSFLSPVIIFVCLHL